MAKTKKISNEKVSCNFEFKIDCLEDLEALEVSRPSFSIVDGQVKLNDFYVMFKDTSNPSCSHALMSLFSRQLQADENYVFPNATLKVFNDAGDIVEEWEYSKLRITNLEFNASGYLTKSYGETLTIGCTCTCKEYTLKQL